MFASLTHQPVRCGPSPDPYSSAYDYADLRRPQRRSWLHQGSSSRHEHPIPVGPLCPICDCFITDRSLNTVKLRCGTKYHENCAAYLLADVERRCWASYPDEVNIWNPWERTADLPVSACQPLLPKDSNPTHKGPMCLWRGVQRLGVRIQEFLRPLSSIKGKNSIREIYQNLDSGKFEWVERGPSDWRRRKRSGHRNKSLCLVLEDPDFADVDCH